MRYVILSMNLVFGIALVYLALTRRGATEWEGVIIGGAFLVNAVHQVATWPPVASSDPDGRTRRI